MSSRAEETTVPSQFLRELLVQSMRSEAEQTAALQNGRLEQSCCGKHHKNIARKLTRQYGVGFRTFYANSEPQPNAKYSCAASVEIAR